jgi:hypothetical protein
MAMKEGIKFNSEKSLSILPLSPATYSPLRVVHKELVGASINFFEIGTLADQVQLLKGKQTFQI